MPRRDTRRKRGRPMLIIGERINTCRQSVMRAYAERDAGFIWTP